MLLNLTHKNKTCSFVVAMHCVSTVQTLAVHLPIANTNTLSDLVALKPLFAWPHAISSFSYSKKEKNITVNVTVPKEDTSVCCYETFSCFPVTDY